MCDSTLDGSKVKKKDRLWAITFTGTDAVRLAITFSGTDAARLQGARASVPTYLYRGTYLRYTGKWVSRKEKNWEPNGWLFLKFYGIFLCTLISQNVIF